VAYVPLALLFSILYEVMDVVSGWSTSTLALPCAALLRVPSRCRRRCEVECSRSYTVTAGHLEVSQLARLA
jgi:hypothetical protein